VSTLLRNKVDSVAVAHKSTIVSKGFNTDEIPLRVVCAHVEQISSLAEKDIERAFESMDSDGDGKVR
jgi:hypothetical protein